VRSSGTSVTQIRPVIPLNLGHTSASGYWQND